ncbi:MAG: SAM-dependent methyltransferase [Bacteroidota bacterium]
MDNNNLSIFIEKIKEAATSQKLAKLTIAKKRNKNLETTRVRITLVRISAGLRLSFVYQYPTREITRNLGIEEGIEEILNLLTNDFYNADLFTATETVQFVRNQKGNTGLKTVKAANTALPELEHDHKKKSFIETTNNIYLRELGITGSDWTLKKDMTAKFRQINKYIEVLDAEFKNLNLPENAVIMDMGSGKGYLTFALYDYFINFLKVKVNITGVEFRKELVAYCNSIATACNYKGLHFTEGSIESTELKKADVLIALHACDTATDEAIWKGITAGASLIVVAPCCQKQIRKQFSVNNEMAPLLKHGILEERQAELITDGLRALIMEDCGYKTKVFEFISTEHTPKNLMITGVKKAGNLPKKDISEMIRNIKKSYGIEYHHLEKLLGKNY